MPHCKDLCLTAVICSPAVPSGRASLEHSAPCWFSIPPQHLNCVCLWMRHHQPPPILVGSQVLAPDAASLASRGCTHLAGCSSAGACACFVFCSCCTSSLLASPREMSHGAVTSKGLLLALCKSEERGQDRQYEVTGGVSGGCLKQSHCSPHWAFVQSEHTCPGVKGHIPDPCAWQAWAACEIR